MGRCKFYKEKEQVSYDRGLTWEDIVPYMYRKGDLYEVDSNDCATHERWTEVPDGYICEDGKKYQKEIKEISEDNLVFDIKYPLEYRKGRVLENDSIECNFKWYGRYTTSSVPHPERYRDPYKAILCYNNGDILTYSDVFYDSEEYFVYSGYVGTCVRAIAAAAFSGHSALNSIVISDSVEVVGDMAFDGCIGLPVECGIRYADTCAVQAIDGLSPKQGTRFIHSNYLSNNGTTGYVKVPDTVVSIASSAFEGSSRMRISVSGCSLNYIGPKAFNRSGLVGSVNLVSDVYQDEIFDLTFANCSGMTDISLPDGIKTIGEYAFSGCTNLTGITIPSGVTNVKNYAFVGSGIKDVNIQSARIWDYAFIGCKNLESITIGGGYICSNAFENCDKLTTVNLGNATLEFGGYGDYSPFKYCNNIKHFKTNSSEIGEYRFLWNSNLKTAEFGPNVNHITGDFSFYFDNAAITSLAVVPPILRYNSFNGPISIIYVPAESLESYKSSTSGNQWSYYYSNRIFPIGSTVITYRAENKLFVDLTGFTPNAIEENYNSNYKIGSITFQSGNQQTIGDSVFYGKTELTQMYISSGFTSIGSLTFANCTNLSAITIGNDVTTIGNRAFLNCSGLTNMDISSALTSIGDYAFSGCSSLTSINIPDSTTSIGQYAFDGCSGLTNLTIGSGLTSISQHAFGNCENLSGITINAITPPTLGEDTFDNTNNCPIYVPVGSLTAYKSVWSDYADRITCLGYRERWINNSDTYECSGTTKMSQEKKQVSYDEGFTWTDVVPLETRAALPVKEYYSTDCGDVPSTVYGKIKFTMDDNSVVTIPCNSSSSITLGETEDYVNAIRAEIGNCVTGLSVYSFLYSINLKNVVIPNTVTSIGGSSFQGCSALTNVYIPDSVTEIGNIAFANCTNLTTINIPSGITRISSDVFNGCTSLENIVIPDSVTHIGREAFYGCTSLKSITIPSGVTYIGESAFTECNGLQSITCLAATPPYVDNSTFAFPTNCPIYVSCNYLDDYINSWWFVAGRLRGIEVQPVTEYRWFATGGYECSGTTKMTQEKKQKSIDSSTWTDVVPLETRAVAPVIEYNSTDCGYVPPVPEYRWVEVSGGYECSGTTKMAQQKKQVSLDNGSTWTDVVPLETRASLPVKEYNSTDCGYVPPVIEGKYQFVLNDSTVVTAACDSESAITTADTSSYKSNIVSAYIGNCTNYINTNTFSGCTNLTNVNVPYNVKNIYNNAFAYCSNLVSCLLGDGITEINRGTFYGCSNLKSIKIPNSVTYIDSRSFINCSGLTDVKFGYNVRGIGYDAFENCSSLTSLVIPSGVTSIGDNAFRNCYSLSSITVDSANTTYDSRNNCNAIIETNTNTLIHGCNVTVIPNTVESIGQYAFYNCSGLTNLTIPDSVTSISGNAFYNCSGLTNLTIGSGLTSITVSSFGYGRSFSSITIDSNNTTYDSRNNCNAIIETATNTLLIGCNNTIIPDSVTSIGVDAFYNCSGLTSINIPSGVTSIGRYAFRNCSGLTSITIPSSVTSISGSAFYDCRGLTSITVEATVPPTLGVYAFDNTHNCPIYVPCDSVEAYHTAWSDYANRIYGIPPCEGPVLDFKYRFILNDSSILSALCDSSSSAVTYDEISPYQSSIVSGEVFDCVSRIDYEAFRNCSGMTSIIIPSGITDFNYRAFQNCSSLTGITVPSGITTIKSGVFSNCSSLTGITIPDSVTSIGDSAFAYCSGLTDVNIPSGVTSIDMYAFRDCSRLTSITIPENVTSIEDWAFSNCSGLTSINIPSGITTISNGLLQECTSLSSVNIPSGVTSIGYQAFYHCSSLTGITIPSGVTSIGNNAFSNCISLTGITVEAVTPPTLGQYYVFSNTNDCPIYVPAASVNAYKSAWSDYANRIQAIP